MRLLCACVVMLSVLSGCVITPAGPGTVPAMDPPRIVEGDNGLRWNNPAAFGSVPEALKATGDAYCRRSGFDRATGYHPDARDVNGNPFPGGGYYCVGKSES